MINITDLIGIVSLFFLFGVIVGILLLYVTTRRKISSPLPGVENPIWCSSIEDCSNHCCLQFPDDCENDTRKRKETHGKS